MILENDLQHTSIFYNKFMNNNPQKIISVTKSYSFEAAHQLPNHDGQCSQIHGHSYQLEVTIVGMPKDPDGSSDEGMVIDFKDLGTIVAREVIEHFDHQFLNDIVDYITTVENLALDIFERLTFAGLDILQVRLWETRKAYATVTKNITQR